VENVTNMWNLTFMTAATKRLKYVRPQRHIVITRDIYTAGASFSINTICDVLHQADDNWSRQNVEPGQHWHW